MTEDVLGAGGKWLVSTWLEKLTGVVESMTDERPTMEWSADAKAELDEGTLFLEQRIASAAEPIAWLGIPEAVHQDLGGRVLAVAGLDSAAAEEKRSTCLEILEQSLAGLIGALTKSLGRDIRREALTPCESFPKNLPVVNVTLTLGEEKLQPVSIAFSSEIISWFDKKPTNGAAAKPVEDSEEPVSDVRTGSRTFDLLLDVALPVSVSFGKAEVPVKEVLKLTTGSIVELNRSISEPVDIIVNGCTIARGEVVVVEGNYGVRIQSIISRGDRLRTGVAAAEARTR